VQRSRSMTIRHFASVVGVGLVAIVACSKDAVGPNGTSIESILVEPSTATVSVGASLTLSAEVLDVNGNAIESPHVSWASADASIAEVSPLGVVTGRKVGTVLIAASARGKDAFSRITVNPTPVASLRLSPTHRAMLVGQTVQLVAEALDAGGNVLAGRPVTWSTSAASVATVTAAGVVTAVADGAAIITASSEGRSAVASITVAQVPVASVVVTPATSNVVVGQSTQLSAQLRDGSGAIITGRAVTWTSTSTTVVTVSSNGLVTAIAPGTATITATSEGRSGSATVNVAARPVSAVIVSPGQVTLFANQTVQLSALVTDDRGQVLPGKPVTFTSSSNQVATVSSSGLVTGISAGTATITAMSEGATGTALVTITPDPVAVVEVAPSTASINVGQSIQLSATPRNIAGNPLLGRTIVWSSGSPSLATVSSSGTVTGVAAGNAIIVATVDGKQGSAVITVRNVPVASVSVTPSTSAIAAGQTVTLAATTLDASGNTLVGRVIGWSSSDNAIATVSSSGVVTGVSVGTATITASSEGQSGIATVTVGAVPVASVTVSPAQTNMTVGQVVPLVATAQDASGQVLTGRTVTWSSASPSVATVSATGNVTGVAAGSAVITATIDGVMGSATVNVSQVPVATVTVAPATANVVIGQNVTLGATTRDAAGNVLTGRVVTWASGATSVATVSATGVVTGVAPGTVTITATSEGQSGTATITVTSPPIDRIVVTPVNPEIDEGDTIQMTATAYDANNNVIPGVTFTWTSSNTNRATVTSTGLVRAINDGNVTIRAAAGGKSGSTTVKIND
jgi:uncharacterized protein YjdB